MRPVPVGNFAALDPNPRVSLELRSLLPYPNSCLGTSPHQQGRDTKMEMLSFGGIDVSKDRLDITVLPDEQCSSVSNDAGRTDRAAARLLDNGDRRRGKWWLRTWCRPGLACGRHVRAPDQSVQAAAVRQGQRDSGP